MKLSLLLLALAAALSWMAMDLRAKGGAETQIVAAQRGQSALPTAGPEQEAPQQIETATTTPSAPPLFRPLQAPSETAAAQSGENYALAGLAGERENRIAFLRDLADQSITRARVGDRVGNWVVDGIDERCVEIRRGRRRQRVCL